MKALNTTEVREKLVAAGQIRLAAHRGVSGLVKLELARWGQVIRDNNSAANERPGSSRRSLRSPRPYAHFTSSARMILLNSFAVVPPVRATAAQALRSAVISVPGLISAFVLPTIACGVPLGKDKPYIRRTRNQARPLSATVGNSPAQPRSAWRHSLPAHACGRSSCAGRLTICRSCSFESHRLAWR